MIISEKQIMELLTIAHSYHVDLRLSNKNIEGAQQVANLINQINWQQSEELKAVE